MSEMDHFDQELEVPHLDTELDGKVRFELLDVFHESINRNVIAGVNLRIRVYYLSPSPNRRRAELFRTMGFRKDIDLLGGGKVGDASFLESEVLSSMLFYLDF